MNLLTLKLTLAHCEVHRHIDKTPEWDTPVHDDSEYWFWISAEAYTLAAQVASTLHPPWNITSQDMSPMNWTVQLVRSSPIQLKSQ